ncbi:MAG: TIGR00153 family protein [Gammaproteobacteria bacterium]|nr:TIGR00153 family protein [Gammaproteobacteria bacterium]
MPITPFLNMFGRSPIRPLEEHMAKVHACVSQLEPFFQVVLAKDWDKVEEMQKEIASLENEADDMKRDLRLHLPKGLFMPVSRSDLLELLSVQDRLANKAKDIAGIVTGRKMSFPDSISVAFTLFLQRCVDASRQANTAIHELDELLETGFSGSEVKLVDGMIATLSGIERDTDEMQIELRNHLFQLEDQIPAVDVMFLYEIIEWTGDLANRAQDVGDRLQIMLAR